VLAKPGSYRPSHGTVVAHIALFIALGGTSYGLATGSSGSREITNNSIRSADIRNNTVRAKEVRRGLHIEETAVALHLQPNTVCHRLRRFEEATGANLRRFSGLVELWWGAGARPTR
jgi:hypothetical protein